MSYVGKKYTLRLAAARENGLYLIIIEGCVKRVAFDSFRAHLYLMIRPNKGNVGMTERGAL
jgi:hypothetical protein